MLVGNGIRLQSNPQRYIFAASSYVSEPGNFNQYGARKNFFIGQGTTTSGTASAVGSWTFGSSIMATSQKSSTSSWAPVTSGALSIGEVGILCIAFDNISTTDGDNSDVTSVTDAAGNTWIKAKEQTNGNGSAATGATVSMWYTKATSTLSSGGAVTINFSGNTTAKSASLNRFTITGSTVSVVGSNSEVKDVAAPGSLLVTPSSGNRQHLFFRAIAEETSASIFVATTNYTATTSSGTAGGASDSNMIAVGEYRIFIGSSDSSAPTDDTIDNASVFVAFDNDVPAVPVASIANVNGSQPSGVNPHYSWLWAIKAGGMSSRNIIGGLGSLTGQLYQGVALASTLAGSCTVTSGMDLVTSLAASLTGSCSVTAGLDSTTALAASLSGVGAITSGLSLIVSMTGTLNGTCTVTAGLSGTLDMEAAITVSAAQDFPTADQNATAVMASIIEAGYSLRDVLALMAARDLGDCTGGPTSPAWKGLDGSTTRVTGTVDSGGNRSSITLTPG